MVLATAVAEGQSKSSPLERGARVRVMKVSDRYEPRRTGVVLSLAGDSAVVGIESKEPATETIALRRLEVHAGRRTRAPEGATIGAALGFGLGWKVTDWLVPTPCRGCLITRNDVRSHVVPTFAVIGLLVGTWRGTKRTTDRWKRAVR